MYLALREKCEVALVMCYLLFVINTLIDGRIQLLNRGESLGEIGYPGSLTARKSY